MRTEPLHTTEIDWDALEKPVDELTHAEMGVEPLRADWERILARAEPA